jgi:hypothetical protein
LLLSSRKEGRKGERPVIARAEETVGIASPNGNSRQLGLAGCGPRDI